MQNVRIRLSYEGTDYGGFQLQKNAVTVQEKLEDALYSIYGKKIRVMGAGRTDSGVHARGQAANFFVDPLIPVEKIPWALNTALPEDIVVWEAFLVPDNFRAGRDAVSKVYVYTIDNARFIQVLRRRYSWHCPDEMDIDLMREGCRFMEGVHDFRSFRALGSNVKNTVRTIFQAEVTKMTAEEIICFKVEGDGFLYKMVRFMAGSLVELGKGNLSLQELKIALQGKEFHPGPALPAKGLCLEKVNYED